MRVAVVGAGPAGLATAYQLGKVGIEAHVFEAGPTVGGLARTLELWGMKADLGPHRFLSADRRVNELWLEVVGRDYKMVNRLTRIFYQGRFFHYPLKPLDALTNLGLAEAARCVSSYARGRLRSAVTDGSFESWVVQRFGRRLFEIFFKSYSEKLWGISCRELDSDFAAQRIKKLTLFEAIKNALLAGRHNPHKTLADEFAYPTGGTGLVYERMAAAVGLRGGKVFCSRPVQRILMEGSRAAGVELEDGSRLPFDHVVSTMPITLLVARLPGVPDEVRRQAATLRFRNTVLVYLNVDAADLFPDNWLYIHSPELRTGRITNFRNWVPQLYGARTSTILAMEYWCYEEDALWQQDDAAFIALAQEELTRTDLSRGARVLGGYVHRIRRCYPVYDIGYRQRLKPVEAYLSSLAALSVIGRYGAFKYNNQDHSLLMGILAAENIVTEAHHDLWSINTDYDNYIEATCITRTGLQKRL